MARKKRPPRVVPTISASSRAASDTNPAPTVNVTAVGPEALAARHGLRFPPPLIEIAPNRAAFEFWWAQMQFAFDLDDPRSFPPLPSARSADDARTLERYVEMARVLAKSTVLNSDDELTVRISDDGLSENVEVKSSPEDATAGFATLLRQFYANDERASFNKVMAILMKEAQAASGEQAEVRIETLRKWGRAAGQLRQKSLEKLGLEKLISLGEFPPLPPDELATYPDPETPEKALSTYFYGDHIHWDKGAPIIDQRAEDPFHDAWFRFFFLKAATGLAHLYLGFSVIVAGSAASS